MIDKKLLINCIQRVNGISPPRRQYSDLRFLYWSPLAFPLLFRYSRYVELSGAIAGEVYGRIFRSVPAHSRKFKIAISVVVIIGVIVAGPA